MKFVFSFLILFLLFYGLGLTAFAQAETVDTNHLKEFEAIYEEYDIATKNFDIKVTEKYLDSDFEMETGKIKIDRENVLKQIKAFDDLVSQISEAKSTIKEIKIVEQTYQVKVSSFMKGTLKSSDGSTIPFELIGESTDIWIKTSEGWREKKQIVHKSKFLINGRELPTRQ